MKKTISTILIIAILNVLAVQCSTLVTIDSEPKGAQVSYQGRQLGSTPTKVDMGDSLFTDSAVTVKLGDASRIVQVERRISVPMLIFNVFFGWFCLGITWLWVAPHKDYQNVLLPNIKPGATTGQQGLTGFNDTVTMKNGQKYEGCKAAVTSDSVVITTRDGRTLVFPKSQVEGVIKGN